jgi:nicotinamidase-related amidase
MRKFRDKNSIAMLFSADNTILLLIDIQKTFLDKLPSGAAPALVDRSVWLTDVAAWLKIPVFATVEEGRYAQVAPALCERIGPERTFTKTSYNAAALKPLADAIRSAGRSSIIVGGLETDVCVSQTALGLMIPGYRVAFIEDLTAASGDGHAYGLARMRASGVIPLSLRGVFYEWMSDARIERSFRSERPLLAASIPFVL